MGDRDLDLSSDNFHIQIRTVAKTAFHPNFMSDEVAYYDVAVLTLSRPFELTPYVRLVCLPDHPSANADVYNKIQVTLTGTKRNLHIELDVLKPQFFKGWGLERRNNPNSDMVLKQVMLGVYSQRYTFNPSNTHIIIDFLLPR